jgi:hypothetical protein
MNAGDSPQGRFKANVTRQMNKGAKVTVKTKISGPPKTMAPLLSSVASPALKSSVPKAQKVSKGKQFRFLGNFHNGGPVLRTGLYLLKRGEHVHTRSPFSRRGS